MVDALVSGASAARRVGSSPILGTMGVEWLLRLLFFCYVVACEAPKFCLLTFNS